MTMSRQRENRCSAKEQTKRAKSRFGIGSVPSAIVGLVVMALLEKCGVQVQAWNHAALPRRVTKLRVEGCADDVHRRAIMATFAASLCGTAMGGSEQAVAAPSMPTSTVDGDDDGDGDNESSPTPSQSSSSNRPRAPKEALVPATQQRLLLEKAIGLANLLVACKEQKDSNALLNQLKEIFEPPLPSTARKSAVSMTRRYEADEPVLQRADVANKMSGVVVRAAMNLYTANLQFGGSYILTASPSVKKALVAKYDGLPAVKQVITADLDLREWYRNLAQTTIEDIQAELYRQEPDSAELVVLLAEATQSFGAFFYLISDNDIREALQLVEDISSGTKKMKLSEQKFQSNNWWS
jgi:hypothetical protein